jgi:hypothetical protein
MNPTLIFASDSLHDTCIARVNGNLPFIGATPNNPFLAQREGDPEAKQVEAEVIENGILITSDNPIDYDDLIEYLKEIGIEVEQLGVDICG